MRMVKDRRGPDPKSAGVKFEVLDRSDFRRLLGSGFGAWVEASGFGASGAFREPACQGVHHVPMLWGILQSLRVPKRELPSYPQTQSPTIRAPTNPSVPEHWRLETLSCRTLPKKHVPPSRYDAAAAAPPPRFSCLLLLLLLPTAPPTTTNPSSNPGTLYH